MDLFPLLENHDFGAVHLGRDAGSGMQCIVAIHDTRLGPAIGGCRFLPYADERDALIDALFDADLRQRAEAITRR